MPGDERKLCCTPDERGFLAMWMALCLRGGIGPSDPVPPRHLCKGRLCRSLQTQR
jgi:hypothetical protein